MNQAWDGRIHVYLVQGVYCLDIIAYMYIVPRHNYVMYASCASPNLLIETASVHVERIK